MWQWNLVFKIAAIWDMALIFGMTKLWQWGRWQWKFECQNCGNKGGGKRNLRCQNCGNPGYGNKICDDKVMAIRIVAMEFEINNCGNKRNENTLCHSLWIVTMTTFLFFLTRFLYFNIFFFFWLHTTPKNISCHHDHHFVCLTYMFKSQLFHSYINTLK